MVSTYAVVGGVPKYLAMWDDRRPVLRNIRELVLSPSTLFRHEAQFLIQDEIAEPRTYLAILEALGAGLKSNSALAEITGVHLNHMGKYLSTLRDLRIVRRVISEDAPDRNNTRLSRYEIRDPFLRFHFELIHHRQGWLEQGRVDKLFARIRDTFDAYVGKTAYEELARRRITRLGDAGELPFSPQHVGRGWTRDVEVDVLAIDEAEGVALAGECKWRRTKMHPKAVDDLRRRVSRFKRLADLHVHLALFSKSGFTKPLHRLAEREGILLFEGPLLERVG